MLVKIKPPFLTSFTALLEWIGGSILARMIGLWNEYGPAESSFESAGKHLYSRVDSEVSSALRDVPKMYRGCSSSTRPNSRRLDRSYQSGHVFSQCPCFYRRGYYKRCKAISPPQYSIC
uniref:Uncharacterized protein n=1 Tax=Picea glauca TaxID=3330 RepID=A0A101M4X0_PICGL|nr:hypothetical protein ABT39_MTgene916 [Picea glauca]